ncbi:MAG: hypothetical protein RJB61_2285, partial [Actinomycetota bacterium]
MSSAVIIAIAVAAVVVLAAIALVTAARRSDVRGAGALSKETRQRDAGSATTAAPTGREVERAASAARGGLATVEAAPPVVWSPPDNEELAVNRRQFLNRASVTLMSAGLGTFAAAGFVAFLWPTSAPVFGGKVSVGKRDDILGSIRDNGGFFYSSAA